MKISKKKQGLTLLEVVIAMIILALVSAGIISGSIQIRRMAEASVRENTASSVAQGFLEQIIAIDFPVLSGYAGNQSQHDFAIRDGGSIRVTFNQPNYDPGNNNPLQIPIGISNGREVPLDFWFSPSVERTQDGLNSLVITVEYYWLDPWSRNFQRREMVYFRAPSTIN